MSPCVQTCGQKISTRDPQYCKMKTAIIAPNTAVDYITNGVGINYSS
jgi:hypothetical protein